MIAYIHGTLMAVQDEVIIVDVYGIGYEIVCPNPSVFQGSLNNLIHIHTYHHVREDAVTLFGFENESLKALFTKLISVSGIGPKSAVNILGAVDVESFASAVEREDKTFLSQFPGVGKKTAQQIILDLKGELTAMLATMDITHVSENAQHENQSDAHLSEAADALRALGYTDREVSDVMPELRKHPAHSTDEAVRQALALLMKK